MKNVADPVVPSVAIVGNQASEGPLTPEEFADWQAHIGRSEIRNDVLSVETLRRFAVAVGADEDVEGHPPPLGHWAFFLDAVDGSRLDADGHPRRGGLMPPIRFPRRMFAASTMQFIAPLTLGAAAELRLSVSDVRHRAGKSGELVFVEVDRSLVQNGVPRIAERQTIVYRGPGEAVAPVQPAPPVDGEGGDEGWIPGPVDLFRFSAVTFNAHRIHYDLDYARDVEGYPGLVVQGPFVAAKLCALAGTAGPVRSFVFRAQAPLFSGQPIRLVAGDEAGAVAAIRCDRVTAMSARAEAG